MNLYSHFHRLIVDEIAALEISSIDGSESFGE